MLLTAWSTYDIGQSLPTARSPEPLPSFPGFQIFDDEHPDETIPHPTNLAKRPLHPANPVAFERAGRAAVPPPYPPSIQKHRRPEPLASCPMRHRILRLRAQIWHRASAERVGAVKAVCRQDRGTELHRLPSRPCCRLALLIDPSLSAAELTEQSRGPGERGEQSLVNLRLHFGIRVRR